MDEKTKTHNRFWMLLAGVMILMAGHGVVLYYFRLHFALSAAVITGVVVLVVVKHIGLLGPLYAILRKPWRRS